MPTTQRGAATAKSAPHAAPLAPQRHSSTLADPTSVAARPEADVQPAALASCHDEAAKQAIKVSEPAQQPRPAVSAEAAPSAAPTAALDQQQPQSIEEQLQPLAPPKPRGKGKSLMEQHEEEALAEAQARRARRSNGASSQIAVPCPAVADCSADLDRSSAAACGAANGTSTAAEAEKAAQRKRTRTLRCALLRCTQCESELKQNQALPTTVLDVRPPF